MPVCYMTNPVKESNRCEYGMNILIERHNTGTVVVVRQRMFLRRILFSNKKCLTKAELLSCACDGADGQLDYYGTVP